LTGDIAYHHEKYQATRVNSSAELKSTCGYQKVQIAEEKQRVKEHDERGQ